MSNSSFKGILSWSAKFLYVKELILLSSETYFLSQSELSSPSNQAKTENPGTSSALKSGYPEEYITVKSGYPEEYVTPKTGYRKNTLHSKLATGRIHYTENWLPGKVTYHFKAAFSEEFCAALLKAYSWGKKI